MGPLRIHIRIVGQCFELAAVQLDVYQMAEVVWKRIGFKGEAFSRLAYTVQLGL